MESGTNGDLYDPVSFLNHHSAPGFTETENPYFKKIDPWNPHITQQLRQLTKADRELQKFTFYHGTFLGCEAAHPKVIKEHTDEILFRPVIQNPPEVIYIPTKEANRLLKAKIRDERSLDAEIRCLAEDIAQNAITKPMAVIMKEDKLMPLDKDERKASKYAGIPHRIKTKFFHEDEAALRKCAAAIARRAIGRAKAHLRKERAIFTPW